MTPPILILAHATDAGAASVVAELERRVGRDSAALLRPELLGLARWSHRVDESGRSVTSLWLPSGRRVDSQLLRVVLHRIQFLPVPRFRRAPPKDRDYAAAELHAVVASWLAALGDRVVPSVRRRASLGLALPPLHWAAAAAANGLPVSLSESSSRVHSWSISGTVVVAGREVGGNLASRFGDACRATAQTLGSSLLEFQFAASADGPILVGASLLPSLTDASSVSITANLLSSLAST